MLKLVKKPKPSKLQIELAELDRQIVGADDTLTQLTSKVDRLESVIANAETQSATLNALMAEDDGTALERLAAGEGDASDIGVIAERVHRAAQAATAARVALPGAQAAVTAQQERLEGLQRDRTAKVLAVTLDRADKVAVQYKRTFEHLAELHDELRAASLAVSQNRGDAFSLVDEALEVPRFELPALRCEGVYSTYLRAVPDAGRINARAGWWRGLIRALTADPVSADLNAAVFEDIEAVEPASAPGLVWLPVRRHADEALTLADTLHAPHYDRPSLAHEAVDFSRQNRGQA